MNDADKKVVDEIKGAFGFVYCEQQLGLEDIQRLLEIIERMEERNKSLEKQLANSIPIVRSYKGKPARVDETDWMEP